MNDKRQTENRKPNQPPPSYTELYRDGIVDVLDRASKFSFRRFVTFCVLLVLGASAVSLAYFDQGWPAVVAVLITAVFGAFIIVAVRDEDAENRKESPDSPAQSRIE